MCKDIQYNIYRNFNEDFKIKIVHKDRFVKKYMGYIIKIAPNSY